MMDAKQAQENIDALLNGFCRDILRRVPVNDIALYQKLEAIVRDCSHPEQLCLNPSLAPIEAAAVDQQEAKTTQDFLSMIGANLLSLGLKKLSDQYKCQENPLQKEEVIRDISEFEEINEKENLVDAPMGRKPFRFAQAGDDLIVLPENRAAHDPAQAPEAQRWVITKKLDDRGQPGAANFYKRHDDVGNDPTQRFLIKEDEAHTCILEGTAQFAKMAGLIPLKLRDAANFASVGVKQDGAREIIMSVQPQVASVTDGTVVPLAVNILNRGRKPKTFFSEESWAAGMIERRIAEMDSTPQWQLAAGIVYSQMVGDESLHIGQFMAETDRTTGNVVGITRIDFGARERYAAQRNASGQNNPYQTSSLYSSSGQLGKDYVSYLLADPDLKNKVTLLWMNLNNLDESALKERIIECGCRAMLEQFSILSPASKEEALVAVLKEINKKAQAPITIPPELELELIDEKIAYCAQKIAELDAQRIITMRKIAAEEFKNEFLYSAEKNPVEDKALNEVLEKANVLNEEMLRWNPDSINVESLFEMMSEVDAQIEKWMNVPDQDETAMKKILQLCNANIKLLETLSLIEMTQPFEVAALNLADERLKKYKTLRDCCVYATRPNASDKKNEIVLRLMKAVSKGEAENFIRGNNASIDALMERRGMAASAISAMGAAAVIGEEASKIPGQILMEKIIKRHHIDPAYLKKKSPERAMLISQQKSQQKSVEGDLELIKQLPNPEKLIKEINQGKLSLLKGDEGSENPKGALTGHFPGGVTDFHRLMLIASPENPDSINAIVKLLTESLGRFKNTELNAKDSKERTPLDYLLYNPDSAKIIQAINARQIKGYGGGIYKVHHFFRTQPDNEKIKQACLEAKALGKAAVSPKPKP